MKKEIIIVSDLWGAGQSTWLNNFQHTLLGKYKIKFYDACKLGQIDTSNYEEDKLHEQFVAFGIDKAIANLIRIEKEPKTYIACSIGGVITWKAALEGLPVEKMIAISSTRLRMETKSPSCDFQLHYGKDDSNRPSEQWLNTFAKDRYQLMDGDHQIYTEKNLVVEILKELL